MKRLFTILLIAAASPLLQATPDLSGGRPGSTPYDAYLKPVSRVLSQLNGSAPSFERVSELMQEGFSFKYTSDTPYVATMPAVTAARHAGDCKAKSLWLASQMNDRSIRYVIGKARRTSKISHAWLMWKKGGQWWILDPTNLSRPIPAKAASPDEYLISYSYDQSGSYRYSIPSGRGMVGGHRS